MIDQRILVRFQEEFNASKDRLARARERVNALAVEQEQYQAVVDDEQGVQDAINEALAIFGQEALS